MCSALTVLHSIESLKQPREGVRGIPTPVSRTTKSRHPGRAESTVCNVTVKRMFKCVAEQVEDHLFPQRSIDIDRFPAGAVDVEGQAARSRAGETRWPGLRYRRPDRSADIGLPCARLRCVKSRRMMTSFGRRTLFRWATSRLVLWRPFDAPPPGGPSMSVGGVRNSWLTLLKNSVFARSNSIGLCPSSF